MQTNNQQQPDDLPLYLALGGAAIGWLTALHFFPFWTLTLTAAVAAAVRAVLWLRR
ncbi:MAG: hypothetical protein KGL51_08120 [Betaproteobacteria bacterium]|nr:hypothetical protein [Betaproteobacteria bacterium]